MRTAVYRFYDELGSLLYVGISTNPRLRRQQHARKVWRPLVRGFSVEWHDSRREAHAAEAEAIDSEAPLFNVAPGFVPVAEPQWATRAAVGLPDGYVGSAEISAGLAVSRQRMQQLAMLPDFPEPEAVLLMGKVWDARKVRAWAQAKGRTIHE